jgi:hypothetical protein
MSGRLLTTVSTRRHERIVNKRHLSLSFFSPCARVDTVVNTYHQSQLANAKAAKPTAAEKRNAVIRSIASLARLYGAQPVPRTHVVERLPRCVGLAVLRSTLNELVAAGKIAISKVRAGKPGPPPTLITIIAPTTRPECVGAVAAEMLLAYGRMAPPLAHARKRSPAREPVAVFGA